MPYIDRVRRAELEYVAPRNPGELNFAVTTITLNWLKGGTINYRNLNHAHGVIERLKQTGPAALSGGTTHKDDLVRNLCRTLSEYWDENKESTGDEDLTNEVIGVLACVQMELYHRVTRPYEEGKIEENGDLDFFKLNHATIGG